MFAWAMASLACWLLIIAIMVTLVIKHMKGR